jgi:putative transcriptional regulator
VSQAVLARHLNVGTKLLSEWERGTRRPSGPSLKLLTLARAKGLDAIA